MLFNELRSKPKENGTLKKENDKFHIEHIALKEDLMKGVSKFLKWVLGLNVTQKF